MTERAPQHAAPLTEAALRKEELRAYCVKDALKRAAVALAQPEGSVARTLAEAEFRKSMEAYALLRHMQLGSD